MKIQIIVLAAAIIMTGCGEKVQKTVLATRLPLECGKVENIETVLKMENKKLIVFGEIHGTVQAPKFVTDVLCHDLRLNNHTILALEIRQNNIEVIEAYLQEPDEGEAMNSFLSSELWTPKLHDGRQSQAMFKLFKSVKRFQKTGYDISVILFISKHSVENYPSDMTRSESAEFHEKDMADNLLKAVQAMQSEGKKGHVIALVGNVHARRGKGQYTQPPYQLMASFLSEKETLTLNVAHLLGSSWNCTRSTEGEVECGSSSGGSPAPNFLSGKDTTSLKRGITVFDSPTKGYDGFFYVGESASASRPAMELLKETK